MRILSLVLLFVLPAFAKADAFDNVTSDMLAKLAKADGVIKVSKVTPEQMVANVRTLPGMSSCFLIVKTNDNRWSRLLIQPGRQRVSDDETIPIVAIERYVTFKEGQEKAWVARGENLRLFEGFRFNLDIGQVVPEKMSADIRCVRAGDDCVLEAVGDAQIYLVTKKAIDTEVKKNPKLAVGDAFDPAYLAGKFKLYDDGRRSGTLELELTAAKDIVGIYYSAKDGKKYEVSGRLLTPPYKVQFTITFPQALQTFDGWLFTGDARAITGSSRLQDREAGFYALRDDD